MILQMPETFQGAFHKNHDFFVYLMQFMDGNRIDLILYPLLHLNRFNRDGLSLLLLDKDGIVEPFSPPNESDYLPTPPDVQQFQHCCNEFWWVQPSCQRLSTKRNPLRKIDINADNPPQLMKMLTWYIGINSDFQVNPGKFGKHFQHYLEPELWDQLLSTYSTANTESIWQAHFKMCTLFRSVAVRVAKPMGYEYNITEDHNVMGYLRSIHNLPK